MGLKALGTTVLVLALAACSSHPRQPSAPAAGAATPPAAAASATAAPAANLAPGATPAAAANPNGQTPVLNRKLVSAGYRPTTIKGEIYYCRTVDLTNTNFKKRVCLTEAQLREEERKSTEMQDRILHQQGATPCPGTGNCAG